MKNFRRSIFFILCMLFLWVQLEIASPNSVPLFWHVYLASFFCISISLYFAKFNHPFLLHSMVFFHAIFTLVIMYPYGNSPLIYLSLLIVFTVIAIHILGNYWKYLSVHLFLILGIINLLPQRMWGVEFKSLDWRLTPFLFATSFIFGILLRQMQLTEIRIKKKDIELSEKNELINQVYQLNTIFQEVALDAEVKSAFNERKRITRDIHDIMGYTLVNLRVMLEVALDLADTENLKLQNLLKDSINHTREGLQSARKDLKNLRNIKNHEESWMNRLYRITETFSRATNTKIEINWGNTTQINCPTLKTAVFQFIQEALTNAYKHGKAELISIDLRVSGKSPADTLTIRVVDNGTCSNEPSVVIPGLGFTGIQERIQELEGNSGYRKLENGFEVWISIPMLSLRKDI